MEKEFVPFELAVKLKELGFNKPCLATYASTGELVVKLQSQNSVFEFFNNKEFQLFPDSYAAPLWQQAFDWFFDKYQIYHQVLFGYGWECIIRNKETESIEWHEGTYNTPYEARLACLEKLIEIVTPQSANFR